MYDDDGDDVPLCIHICLFNVFIIFDERMELINKKEGIKIFCVWQQHNITTPTNTQQSFYYLSISSSSSSYRFFNKFSQSIQIQMHIPIHTLKVKMCFMINATAMDDNGKLYVCTNSFTCLKVFETTTTTAIATEKQAKESYID